MRIALCSTTIHVPTALELLRRCSEEVEFFIACDKKTPVDANVFCDTIPNTWAIHADQQEDWRCSSRLGWNTLARRNIAFLEALKWGADAIYSWDNDNLNIGLDHFDRIEMILDQPFHGLEIGSNVEGWFDPGQLLIPPTRHRGIPHARHQPSCVSTVVDRRIGVAAGLVLGDPDIDATTRMEIRPDIGAVHTLGQAGIVVDCHTWTVFNSQNTTVIRELIPAWFMMPGVGRHDDIYASLIVQRVARERGLHVHFGQPFTYQQRNEHNLITDLRAEIDGMENVPRIVNLLDHIQLSGCSVLDDTRKIYDTLLHCAFIPQESAQAALYWLEDCEGVL